MPLLNSLILLLLNTSHLSAKSSTITAANTLLLLTSTMVSITIVSASPNLNLAFYVLANTRFSSRIILKFWPAESTTIPAWTRSVLIVIALATKPSTAWYQFCAVFAKRVILVWIAILPVGSSNRWMEDVTVDSAEDDASDCSYGHNKEYLPLVPVLLPASRTISKIFAPPDVSPATNVLPTCFNDSPFDTLLWEMFFGSHHSSRDCFPPGVAGFCFLLQEVLFSSLEREFHFTDSAPFLVFLPPDWFWSRPLLGLCAGWFLRKL